MYGFYRVATAVPHLQIANIEHNENEILNIIEDANQKGVAAVNFPELCITGYTCGDLFYQKTLLKRARESLFNIKEKTKSLDIVLIIGFPFEYHNSIYNCAAIINKGAILGIVPKINLPNHREFYEKRWFTPWKSIFKTEFIELFDQVIPIGPNIIFEYNQEFKFSVEICEDLWSIIPPSSFHSLAGSLMNFNISASNDLVGKSDYRKELIKNQSARCFSAYIYSSSGVRESTSDLLYGGHTLIAENGSILHENEKFQRENSLDYADIDCQKLRSLRNCESTMESFYNQLLPDLSNLNNYHKVKIPSINQNNEHKRKYNPQPFVPINAREQNQRCSEIFNIQASALAKRLGHINAKKSVVGISGGLDSTLALLVIKEAHKLLGKSNQDIITITMPGFGTTGRTYNNAVKMCNIIGCELREINIEDVSKKQFELLNVDQDTHSTTYENVQARQRTMLLMNTANKESGIVIGTGDLSEISLGWSTYNGDHMSMYAVNCGVPKTLIRYLIEWYANNSEEELKETLIDIIDTPVSPELLPPDKQGNIQQKTEDILGPYELHDFFLYHLVKYGAPPEKINYLGKIAFEGKYSEDYIYNCLHQFIKRFFAQQFKRNCIPDGPKIGTIALSPRGDWRMPPDASAKSWLNEF